MKVKNSKDLKIKAGLVLVIFMVAILLLMIKLFVIVTNTGKNYDLKVLSHASERTGENIIANKRGKIVDRNGIVLADSVSVYKLIFDAKLLNELSEEKQNKSIDLLVKELGFSESDLRDKLKKQAKNSYIILGSNYTYTKMKSVKEAIDTHIISGIFYEESYLRSYPYPLLASDVIGFVNKDLEGMYGLEKTYNSYLKGHDGRAFGTIEKSNNIQMEEIDATNGYNVMTTIDYTVQKYIQSAIDEYFEEEDAKQIHVIVMNPNNGEILGMANYPNFDLNNPRDMSMFETNEDTKEENKQKDEFKDFTDEQKLNYVMSLWKNENITDTYEYGSTFKPFVFAAALEENMVTEDEEFYCDGGKRVADRYIECWKHEGHGKETIFDGLNNSCNVVFMDVAEKIGRDLFYEYQHLFGFGAQTGIDLEGETSSRANVYELNELNPVELATSAFGQGFNGTPIQLISGFCSLINGGYLYEPHIMKKIYNEDQVLESNTKHLIRQTISSEVSNITRKALGGVVHEGTGAKAKIAGYEIGGKTGTAEKHERDDLNYIVSFIGFAPVENPQIITLVVVDEPVGIKVSSKYAAKIFVSVMEKVMPYLHIFKEEKEAVVEPKPEPEIKDIPKSEKQEE